VKEYDDAEGKYEHPWAGADGTEFHGQHFNNSLEMRRGWCVLTQRLLEHL
jgi:hypothetical protein